MVSLLAFYSEDPRLSSPILFLLKLQGMDDKTK